MADERIDEIVKGNKIADLIYTAIFNTARQVPDGWGILTPEEKDRIEGVGRAEADKVQYEISARLEAMFKKFIASDRKYFTAVEKGIAIKDGGVAITLTALRNNVPDEVYTHRGEFMVIITDGEATMAELNQQADMFPRGGSPAAALAEELRTDDGPAPDSPIVAQFRASQAQAAAEREATEPAADPFDLWVDEFLIGAGQIMGAEIAAQYDQGGEFAWTLPMYFGNGWGPAEAAANETIAMNERRDIAAGPHPIDEADAAESVPDGFNAWHDAFLLALAAAGHSDMIEKFQAGGALSELVVDYFDRGWEPVEAMANETVPDGVRRLIADGPPARAA
jgi:hypothetical protein